MPEQIRLEDFKRVLVLIPHPDDEVIGCGGLLTKLFENKVTTLVTLVTDGSGAGELPEGTSRLRLSEFDASMETLNPSAKRLYLNLPDGRLSETTPVLKQKLLDVISEYQPSEIIAPWPMDLHPDHSSIGKTLLKITQHSGTVKALYFYEVWSPVPANVVIDISEIYPKKEIALNKHKTALKCGDYIRAMRALNAYRSLLTVNMAKADSYAEAYFKLNIEPTTKPESLTFNQASLSHQKGIEDLFEKIYGPVPSINWWAWKYHYELNKGIVAVDDNGQIIAFYGNLSRKAYFKGEELWCSQVADVMIDSAYRIATKRSGTFLSLSRRFLDQYVGEGKNYPISLGFPHPRALKLGIQSDVYQAGTPLFNWEKQVSYNIMNFESFFIKYQFINSPQINHLRWVDELYSSMVELDLSDYFVLKRSSEFWTHRFFNRPDKHYDCFKVSRFGKPIAAAVIAIGDDCIDIIDIVFARKQDIKYLIHGLKRHAYKTGAGKISAWGSEPFVEELGKGTKTARGFMALPSEKIGAILTDKIRNSSWITSGDADFT